LILQELDGINLAANSQTIDPIGSIDDVYNIRGMRRVDVGDRL